MKNKKDSWYAYLVCCRDQTLYAGIAKNPEKRLIAHNTGKNGAKYTRSRRPVTLVYLEEFPTRSAAARREMQLKRMGKAAKEDLLSHSNPPKFTGEAEKEDERRELHALSITQA